MATEVNYIDCEAGARKGTGVLSCKIPTEIPDGFIAVSPSWEFDPATEDFNAAYIVQKIQEGVFHPFLKAVDFNEQNEDTTFKTYNTGIKIPTRRGLPELEFTYSNEYSWHAAAYSFNGYGNYNFILGWKNGVIGVATKADGKLTGLSGGYLNVKTFKNNNGSDPSETMIGFQLTSDAQYNSKMALLKDSVNGFSIDEVRGVIDAKITVTLPAVGATTTVVKVVAEYNPAVEIKGLAFGDFKITGKTVTASTFNSATGEYTLTHDAYSSEDAATVKLNDGTYDIVKSTTDVLYKGESASFTIV
ncbi:hypothetical protein [Aquimarina macrocephali]|uniref:hypothetical protein n=1 Tax=Aquimarina macrocephali TaxID=666563 RepID=UPI003F67322B